MNIDDLKIAWQEYDHKLKSAQTLNQRLIDSMIGEKSQSRLAKVQNQYLLGISLSLFWLVLGVAVLTGNPFDYVNVFEYLPVFVLILCFVMMLLLMGKAYYELRNINIGQISLGEALRQILSVYDKPKKFLKWTVIIMFSSSLLFPLSFLPRNIAHNGVGAAIIDTLIAMVISLVMYFIAQKLGTFKDMNADLFKAYLHELEELKALSKDLS